MARQYLVPAVNRALQVIELLSNQDSGMSISEIHRSLSLPLSSAANIVYTLKTLGYLQRDNENSHYRVSLKMLGISRRLLARMDSLGACHGLLEELVRESGLTAHLAVLREGESIYVDRVASDGLVQFSSYIGMRWPAHSSAVGKALLAFLPDTDLRRTLHSRYISIKLRREISRPAVPYKHSSCLSATWDTPGKWKRGRRVLRAWRRRCLGIRAKWWRPSA